jgi:hypothetical protein
MQRTIRALSIAVIAFLPLSAQETRPGHGGHDTRPARDPHAGHTGQAPKAGTLMVDTDPAPKAGQPTTLKLMIHEADGTMVAVFETLHEAKVHLMIVRDALDQFAHVHPEVDGAGNMTIRHTFPTAGVYRLYADYKPVKKDPAVATAEVKVAGEAPAAPKLQPDAPGKVKGDGLGAEIVLSGSKTTAPVRISFRVLDGSDQAVTDLQPYLGAMGHLVLISADGKEYVHVHPHEKGPAPEKVEFDAHFRKPGVYKGWGQFQRAGKVHHVPFVLRVD